MRSLVIWPSVVGVGAGVGLISHAQGNPWWNALWLGAFAGALAGGLCVLSNFPLLTRIRSIADSARGAAEGNLRGRADAVGEDEMASIGQSLNLLTDRYREQVESLSGEVRKLGAVLEGMSEGVWVTDGTGAVVRHNPALARMLPLGAPILGQRPLSLLRAPELHQAVLNACEHKTSSNLELQFEGMRARTFAVQVSPLGEGLVGSTAVFHELTELRKLEKVRKDFVANVSHELRTPITAIRGYAETLRAGALQDAAHAPRMVEIIHRQSERLSELVEDLLEISRLEAQELTLERKRLAVSDVVQRAAEAVRPTAQTKGVALELALPAGVHAVGDPRGLEQVLLNLLDNAVKYTPSGGRVDVCAWTEANRCLLAIRDTGVGIEEKHLSRIFERFYRVDKGRSRELGGTGLGLSIVKHLLGAMEGDIRVRSQPGSGSTFTVVLPLAPPE